MARGAPSALLTHIKRQFELAPDYIKPIQFEERVLRWKHTDDVRKQAASKKQGATYAADFVLLHVLHQYAMMGCFGSLVPHTLPPHTHP